MDGFYPTAAARGLHDGTVRRIPGDEEIVVQLLNAAAALWARQQGPPADDQSPWSLAGSAEFLSAAQAALVRAWEEYL